MVDISTYDLHGTCFFENVIYQRAHPSIRIGQCRYSWFSIELKYEIINNRVVVCPTIWIDDDITVQYYFKFLKPDGSSGITEERRIVLKATDTLCGPKIKLETLEDEGYLESGGLRIQYGFHVESWRDNYGVWNFNFGKPFFNGDYCCVKVLNGSGTNQFYGHKQIFAFHYKTTNDEIIFLNQSNDIINIVFQMAHGVPILVNKLEFFPGQWRDFIDILSFAVHYGLPNVVRIIEMKLMKNDKILTEDGFELAVFWNLPHLLAHFLKGLRKDFVISKLTKYCGKPEILERMSGESMKQLMKFLLDY